MGRLCQRCGELAKSGQLCIRATASLLGAPRQGGDAILLFEPLWLTSALAAS
jgi:hypothetical protein